MDTFSKHIPTANKSHRRATPKHTHTHTHTHNHTLGKLFTFQAHYNLVRVVLVASMVARARVAAAEHEVFTTL